MGNTQNRQKTSQHIGGAVNVDATAATPTQTQQSRHLLNDTNVTAVTSSSTTGTVAATSVAVAEIVHAAEQRTVITSCCVSGSGKSLQQITSAEQQNRQASAAPSTSHAAAAAAAESSQTRGPRQLSTWSLGSLGGGRLNWSFSAARNSFRHRNKATRKSLTSLQGSRRHKTQWHRPLTNAIFISHFKQQPCRSNQFDIEQLVAKGAFGVVFKVRETSTSSTLPASSNSNSTTYYALKVLKKSTLIEENSVQQIKDEADIQKLCGHHPFIVQQIGLWQNRHNLHILSEYVPNGELFSKIARFSIDLVRLYVAEIALAIDFLHNAGIIYRDAKPENILLTDQLHIKLTDFGLSKWLKLGNTTRTICGTFKYMAPEILRGEAYNHAVDWWALGVIVCQMLTQKCPNTRRHLMQRQQSDSFNRDDGMSNAPSIAHINGCLMDSSEEFLPEAVNGLPPEARDILERLLVLEPQQRIHSILALQRIALFKGYKLESKHLLRRVPREIIARDQIHLFEDNQLEQNAKELATKAFRDF